MRQQIISSLIIVGAFLASVLAFIDIARIAIVYIVERISLQEVIDGRQPRDVMLYMAISGIIYNIIKLCIAWSLFNYNELISQKLIHWAEKGDTDRGVAR